MDDVLKELLAQEQELQFAYFNEMTAWELGKQMMDYGVQNGLPITIDIRRGKQQLFHASLPGTSADNDAWIKRKVRLVNRFGHSSFYMGQLLKHKGKSIEESYLIPAGEFAAHGGCFPIIIKNSGVIGTITVSGLPQEVDHHVVVLSIRAFLLAQKEG